MTDKEKLLELHAKVTEEYETIADAWLRYRERGETKPAGILRAHTAYLLGQMAGIARAISLLQ